MSFNNYLIDKIQGALIESNLCDIRYIDIKDNYIVILITSVIMSEKIKLTLYDTCDNNCIISIEHQYINNETWIKRGEDLVKLREVVNSLYSAFNIKLDLFGCKLTTKIYNIEYIRYNDILNIITGLVTQMDTILLCALALNNDEYKKYMVQYLQLNYTKLYKYEGYYSTGAKINNPHLNYLSKYIRDYHEYRWWKPIISDYHYLLNRDNLEKVLQHGGNIEFSKGARIITDSGLLCALHTVYLKLDKPGYIFIDGKLICNKKVGLIEIGYLDFSKNLNLLHGNTQYIGIELLDELKENKMRTKHKWI